MKDVIYYFCILLVRIKDFYVYNNILYNLITMNKKNKETNSPRHLLFFVCTAPLFAPSAEPHSSVGSSKDLRTGGRSFDPRLGQYSFRE